MTTRESKLEYLVGQDVTVYTVQADHSVLSHTTYCTVPMLRLKPEEQSKIEAKLKAMGVKNVRVVTGPEGTVGFVGTDL